MTERRAGASERREEILGLIDYLAVEWPGGHVTGEGFQLLLDLADRNIVRVLDLEFITKTADGTVKKVALGDIEHGGDVDVTIWDGASAGLLDQSDIDQVAAVIRAGPGKAKPRLPVAPRPAAGGRLVILALVWPEACVRCYGHGCHGCS